MEESMISTNYTNKAVADASSSGEESSWTLYLDDFKADPCASQHEDEHSLLTSGSSKIQRFHKDEDRQGGVSPKRRKTRAIFVDRDLEDTATSPDHSPKEYNLFQTLNKQADLDGVCIGTSQGHDKSDYSELRRKGLCLVPMSIIFNCVL